MSFAVSPRRDHLRAFAQRVEVAEREKTSFYARLPPSAALKWRKGWDSNPRGSVNPLAVFKTAALNRSATLPVCAGVSKRADGVKA